MYCDKKKFHELTEAPRQCIQNAQEMMKTFKNVTGDDIEIPANLIMNIPTYDLSFVDTGTLGILKEIERIL